MSDTEAVRARQELTDALRSDFETWTVDAVEQTLGDRAVAALAREHVVPAIVAARAIGDDRLALLSRLFMVGDTVTARQASHALPLSGVDAAVEAGLLERSGHGDDDEVRALVDIRPYTAADGDTVSHWWIASDLTEAVTGSALRPDHVLGVGGASATLASATMRTPVNATLDLGTGSGIQALHASLHSRAVTATDISPRALSYARFNRQLNVPDARWDVRQGSLLEPVASEAFDLVVSNPPFVITVPGAPSFEYRDGGHGDTGSGGDGIVRTLISSVGTVLAEGGVAQMLGNWEVHKSARWIDRVQEWIEASPVPLDAWVIQRDELDGAHYAEMWLRDSGLSPHRDRVAFDAAYRAYLSDFDSRGVESIGLGIVLLRRAKGAPSLRRFETHEGELPSPLGPHLVAALDAHDWLASHSDEDVLATRWTVASDVTTESYAQPGASDPQHILLRQGGAFGRAVKADTALAGFVGACDGELTAGQLAGALAALLDVPSDTMATGLAVAVRDLAFDGFLLRG